MDKVTNQEFKKMIMKLKKREEIDRFLNEIRKTTHVINEKFNTVMEILENNLIEIFKVNNSVS